MELKDYITIQKLGGTWGGEGLTDPSELSPVSLKRPTLTNPNVALFMH